MWGKCYQIGLVVILGILWHYSWILQCFQNFEKFPCIATIWYTPPQNVGKMLPKGFGSDFRHIIALFFNSSKFSNFWKISLYWDHMAHPSQNVGKMLPNRFGSDFRHIVALFLNSSKFSKFWKIYLHYDHMAHPPQNVGKMLPVRKVFKHVVRCLKSLPNRFGSIFPTFWGGVCHMVAIQGNFSKLWKFRRIQKPKITTKPIW